VFLDGLVNIESSSVLFGEAGALSLRHDEGQLRRRAERRYRKEVEEELRETRSW
jgi:hypothetical protein